MNQSAILFIPLPRSVEAGDLTVRFCGNPAEEQCHMGAILVWLSSRGGGIYDGTLHSLCTWLAFVLEQGTLWRDLSTDALLDAPVPRGPQRSRRVDPVLRNAIAKETQRGELCRTSAQATKLLKRVRRNGFFVGLHDNESCPRQEGCAICGGMPAGLFSAQCQHRQCGLRCNAHVWTRHSVFGNVFACLGRGCMVPTTGRKRMNSHAPKDTKGAATILHSFAVFRSVTVIYAQCCRFPFVLPANSAK